MFGQQRFRDDPMHHGALSGAGDRRVRGRFRWAGPWSGMKTSVTLSMIVVIVTASTGSSGIRRPPPFSRAADVRNGSAWDSRAPDM